MGDGAAQYTDAQLQSWLRRTFTRSNTTEGVHAGYANELAVTGAVSPVAVNTGAALVDGIPYENTASVNQAVATPSVGTTGHRIVLRANWAAQTVRVTDVASADGVAAIPALVQIQGTTWDISLATLTITTLGAITLTDARAYLHPTSRVSTAMIDDESVTAAKIANRTRTLFVPATAAYNNTDSAWAISDSEGVILTDAKQIDCFGRVYIPSDFVSLTSVKAVVQSSAAGNMYVRQVGSYAAVGFTFSGGPQEIAGPTAIAVAANVLIELTALTLSGLVINQYLSLAFRRDAASVLDTVNAGASFLGWVVTYTADS